ncbi:hypothetical protein HanXRQr2_Chr17g0788361 [Helianthus annuus]|uniref:Uncharacterized protein n=1 Tax=Helianthus annuus TaxID=4232 RepID=A0A9K3GTF9_HELAN|nr:hypothetical protein HanXRQr2_Chr17g0788361 [Helianthus annuus]KAJ0811955.1 hypothetical protein HanPSC8_Chr17g0756481 [Helianthus annuus]
MELRQAVHQMPRSFLVINKSHKPEIMTIHRHNLNVSLRRVLPHRHRIHRPNILQRYHHLFNS